MPRYLVTLRAVRDVSAEVIVDAEDEDAAEVLALDLADNDQHGDLEWEEDGDQPDDITFEDVRKVQPRVFPTLTRGRNSSGYSG